MFGNGSVERLKSIILVVRLQDIFFFRQSVAPRGSLLEENIFLAGETWMRTRVTGFGSRRPTGKYHAKTGWWETLSI